MTEVVIDSDGASPHFSSVGNGGAKDISVSPGEKSLYSGRGEFMSVTQFVDKQDDVSNLGNLTLQTTVEENIKLTRTLINNLSREGEL